MSNPTTSTRTLEGIAAHGLDLIAEFSDGTTQLHAFPHEAIKWGAVLSWNEEAGTVEIEDEEDSVEMTIAELLDTVDMHEVEFLLGYVCRYNVEYIEHQMDPEWITTTRRLKVYAVDVRGAFAEFHRRIPHATNVDITSREHVRDGARWHKAA